MDGDETLLLGERLEVRTARLRRGIARQPVEVQDDRQRRRTVIGGGNKAAVGAVESAGWEGDLGDARGERLAARCVGLHLSRCWAVVI